MTQVLPTDESFVRPSWILPDAGSTSYAPYFWWYIGFKGDLVLRDDPSGSDWGYYPLAVNGSMPSMDGAPVLILPRSDSATALPVINSGSDSNGFPFQYGVLCREEDSFSHDDQDITITFGVEEWLGSGFGYAHSGTDGSSPTPGGRYVYPSSPSTSGHNFSTMSRSNRGNWTSGGAAYSQGTDNGDLNPWYAWPGNGLFFRCGGGEPLFSDITGGLLAPYRADIYQAVDCYQFLAYPTSGDKHLRLELWRIHHTNNGGTANNYARMLIRQEVANGCSKIDFRQPFHLRVKVENDATPDVEIECFIGKYTKDGSPQQDEVQCFKNNAMDTDNDFTLGPMGGVVHGATTGVVRDGLTAGADPLTHQIVVFANKTIGWCMPGTYNLEVSTWTGEPGPVWWSGNQGLYSVESKSIPTSGDPVVRYRDEFERCVEAGLNPNIVPIVQPVTTWFGIEGMQIQGMFTWDAITNTYPYNLEPPNNPNYDMVRRLLEWGSATAVLDYDGLTGTPTIHDLNRPYDVMKSFVWMVPSSQLYNHHRKIEFWPGSQSGAVSQIKYEFGILLRGQFDGNVHNGLVCYIEWWTDGSIAAAITYGEVTLAYRNCLYTTADPAGPLVPDANDIIARKKYPSGTASGFPDLHDGSWHNLDALAVAYEGATTPDAAGIYTVELDGVPIQFDDDTAPYQSGGTTPFPVVEPFPRVYMGRTEGIYLLANLPMYGAAGTAWTGMLVRNWTEESMAIDPGGQTGSDLQETILIDSGEGTPTGELNTVIGALAIPGLGVWDVNARVQMTDVFPVRYMTFDSGHTYGSPVNSQHRRNWRVQISGMDMDVYQALQTFFNDHNGMEVPFTFIVPISNDGTEPFSVAGSTETVFAWIIEDRLTVREIAPETYVASFTVEELLLRNTV